MQIKSGKPPVKPQWANKLMLLEPNNGYILVDIGLRKKLDVYIGRLKKHGLRFQTAKDGDMLRIYRLK